MGAGSSPSAGISPAPPARLAQPRRIIVIGDSFTVESTHGAGTTWPHFLARDTGLDIGVFDSGIDPVERILASPAWRNDPPAALLYEIVERSLIPAFRGTGGDCVPHLPAPRRGLTTRPLDIAPATVERATARAWDDWPASYAMNFLLQNGLRQLRGRETTSAVRLELARGGLFSSRHDRSLLVYAEDFNKMGWGPA